MCMENGFRNMGQVSAIPFPTDTTCNCHRYCIIPESLVPKQFAINITVCSYRANMCIYILSYLNSSG